MIKHPKRTKILIALLIAAFICTFTIIVVAESSVTTLYRENARDNALFKSMNKTIDDLFDPGYERYVSELYCIRAEISAVSMEKDVAKKGDSLIARYPDGAIVKVKGGVLSAPAHVEEELGIDASCFEDDWESFPSPKEKSTLVAYSKIGDSDYYYVRWFENTIVRSEAADLLDVEYMAPAIEGAYDAFLILVDRAADDPDEYIIRYSGLPAVETGYMESEKLKALGIDIENPPAAATTSPVKIGEELYFYNVKKMDGIYDYAVILLPGMDSVNTTANNVVFIVVIFYSLMIGVGVAGCSLYGYVRDNALPPALQKRYAPVQVRKFAAAFGVFGLILMALSGVLICSLTALYTNTETGTKVLVTLENEIDAAQVHWNKERLNDEFRFGQYAEDIADALNRDPSLRTEEMLEKFEDCIGAERITLYDSNGLETVSSGRFINLTLDEENGSSEKDFDFRMLLKGSSFIVQEEGLDSISGIDAVKIGQQIDDLTDEDKYGAMIISAWAGLIGSNDDNDYSETLDLMTTDSTDLILVDPETNLITDSSYESGVVRGDHIKNVGLSEEDVKDKMMKKVTTPQGVKYAVSNLIDNVDGKDRYAYYLADVKDMNTGTLPFVLTVTITYLIMYIILVCVLLHWYTPEYYEEYKLKGTPVKKENLVMLPSGEEKISIDPSKRWLGLKEVYSKIQPEQKAAYVLQFLLAQYLLTSICGTFLNDRSGSARDSLYYYIAAGDWEKGFNLFALAAIGLLGAQVFVCWVIVKLILHVISSILGTKGDTVCRLFSNLANYVAVISFLYFTMLYLGFNPGTLLASVGLLTLAVSLGAKDLIAGVFAGMAIVFEGDFQVGDIVDINGYRGTVVEIGVRSTKILGDGGNIKIINNLDVKNVINMTQLNSWYAAEFTISSATPIEEVEEILDKELPKIGEKYDEIISGPTYKGVLRITGNKMTLSIITECEEDNYRHVQRIVNRSIQRIFRKNGIEFE